MQGGPKFNQLLPILFVRYLESEINFYKSFGFRLSYQGDEFPGFVGLKKDNIEFGLEERKDFDPQKAKGSFIWQMDTDNFSKVIAICKKKDFEYSGPKQYWERMDGWEMYIKTPNGYTLQLEKIGKD